MRILTMERPAPAEVPQRAQSALGAAALGLEALEGVPHGAERIGAIVADGPLAGSRVDLNRALAVKLALDDAGAPEAQADSLLPAESARFMQRWPESLEIARSTLSFVARAAETYDAPDWVTAGVVVPSTASGSKPPVPHPANLLAAEDARPTCALHPIAAASLAQQGEVTQLPDDLVVHAHAALATVIARPTQRIRAAEAADHIAGYCAALCLVGSRLHGEPLGPSLGRSCDAFTVLGPWLVTSDEAPRPADLHMRMRCSGELVESSGGKLEDACAHELLARATELLTLDPGDLLLIPLPGHRTRQLRGGDVVDVEIEGLGRVLRHIREAAA